jgi:hypothetical protein
MEEKFVRRWAENDGGKAPVDQGHGLRSACEAMDKHRALIESMDAIEIEDFCMLSSSTPSAACRMNGRSAGSLRICSQDVAQAKASVPNQNLRRRGSGTRGQVTLG